MLFAGLGGMEGAGDTGAALACALGAYSDGVQSFIVGDVEVAVEAGDSVGATEEAGHGVLDIVHHDAAPQKRWRARMDGHPGSARVIVARVIMGCLSWGWRRRGIAG